MSVENTELANVETGEIVEYDAPEINEIDKFIEDFNSDSGSVVTTLDLNDIDAQDEAMAAMSTAEGVQEKLIALPNNDKDAGIEFTLVDFICTPSELPVVDAQGNPTGEVRPALRTVMIADSGDAYSTHSMPVAKQLRVIKTLRDRAKVQLSEKPVQVRLVHSLTSNKRNVIALQIVRKPRAK